MQVSDDLYLGNAGTFIAGPDSVGNPGGRGVGPMGRLYVFDVVPLTLQAAGLAASQAVAGAGNLTLTAGTGVTAVVGPDGVTRYVLDTPRNVSVVSSNAGDTTQTVTVSGYDVYGQPMTEVLTLNGVTTVNGKKAFKSVWKMAVSAALAGNASAGYGNTLGLPFIASDAGYVVSVKWNNTLAADAGTFTKADATSPATTTTGDVRGTYLPSSAADGTKRLVLALALPALASGPFATRKGALGVDQV